MRRRIVIEVDSDIVKAVEDIIRVIRCEAVKAYKSAVKSGNLVSVKVKVEEGE